MFQAEKTSRQVQRLNYRAMLTNLPFVFVQDVEHIERERTVL